MLILKNKMKNSKKVLLFVFVFFGSLLCSLDAFASTIVSDPITEQTVWTKNGSPYLVMRSIDVNAPLKIEPGVVVKFQHGRASAVNAGLIVNNELTAIGTGEEKIVFTSILDDENGGDDNGDVNATTPGSGDWIGLSIVKSPCTSKLEHVVISYASYGIWYVSDYYNNPNYTGLALKNSEIKNNGEGLHIFDAVPTIQNNTIKNNSIGIRAYSGNKNRVPIFRSNSIIDNGVGLNGRSLFANNSVKIDARYNWWGDVSGPYFEGGGNIKNNLEGKGNNILGPGVMFDPWLKKNPANIEVCNENCFSNVLFLPGIKTSRLYKDGALGTEDQLWVPNFFGNDVNNLDLDENGKSINDVYTRDILREDPVGRNIYETFFDKLDSLKKDRSINDFELFAYDWRQSVQDVVKNGTPYPNGEMRSVIASLISLSESSKGQKVTLIAHSNGGLLAKAIMEELEKLGLSEKVDKIVLVGSPQMGTPLATLSLLYGYDESALFGSLISGSDSRTFAENMPGAYGLLPSRKYFEQAQDPFISFSSQQTRYKDFRDAYEDDVDNYDEFGYFLLGYDGRSKPERSELEKENVLNENLFGANEQMHASLDAWEPPTGVQLIQIAGWGLDTVSGVDYSEKEKIECTSGSANTLPICVATGEYEPVYEPKFTVDGDEVVVSPSALMLPEDSNVKRYWVDLWSNNKGLTINREHKDILEVSDVKDFISNIIFNKDSSLSLPENITDQRPSPEGYSNAKSRLRMSLYSPLDIHLYDDAGNHTGPKKITIDGGEKIIIEENIPNSYYYQFGDRKYVGVPCGEHIRMQMKGYDTGSYTLKMKEVKQTENGEEIISSTTFSNFPVSSNTSVFLDIPKTGVANLPDLKADYDGDGKNDYQSKFVPDGIATVAPVEDIKDDNVTPGLPPVVPAAVPVVESSKTNNSSGGGHHHKKKNSHKKSHKKKHKKTITSQVKKVLGISTSKNSKPKSIIAKSWKNLTKKTTTTWNNVVKSTKTFKDLITKPFNYFRR